jgi:small subunit ribosomal protein S17
MGCILTGAVMSDKTDKTIVINVSTRKTHPLYKKQYTRNTRFMAHDPKNEAKIGDLVEISETRPISTKKRFILTKIIKRGGIHFEEKDATADVPEEEVTKKAAVVKPEQKEEK